ncbi:MAG: dethiobiotin synthase, partial [Bacteroidota bacterium]
MIVFVTGISTEVGKTVASAIVVEALEADYWKPVQAGDLDNSDSHKIERLISNTKTKIHPNSYALNTPMSPHAAAEIDGIRVDLEKIVPPQTENHLVIEGAGGLLVPLNEKDTINDLILTNYKVIVVSRHYLGSINHTLLFNSKQ